jgi:predicted RNA-binding Zn-ribbon protein involved in translation (DUF1610 family)
MSPLSDNTRELLLNGIASAKEGDLKRARFYLEWVLREPCTSDQRVKALYYLGKVAETPQERLQWIEQLLMEDPLHPEARRDLAILRGQISAQGIPDPNRPPAPPPTAPLAKRKTNCDQCGGKLVFSPDGKSLDCERCGLRFPIGSPSDAPVAPSAPPLTPAPDDFVVQLAQAKGHVAPPAALSFTCTTCGASFALSEPALSLACPYCGTGFIPEANPRDWVAPYSVLPFQIHQKQASEILRSWWNLAGVSGEDLLRDIFIPIWDFDMTGALQVTMSDGSGTTLSEWPVDYGHILVPGTRSLPAPALTLLGQIDFFGAEPYRPALLTNRLAEMYTIAPADASLTARESVLRREASTHTIHPAGFLNPAQLCTSSCRLILAPFWVARRNAMRAFIHGQSGSIAGDR